MYNAIARDVHSKIYRSRDLRYALSSIQLRISELGGKYAPSVLTLKMFKAKSNVNLDHVSFNIYHQF
jgi:hypothetical protein